MSEAGEALTGGEGGEGTQGGATVESWLQSAPEGAWESPEVFNALLESAPDDIRGEQSLTASGRIQSLPSLLRSHVHAQKHMGGEKLAMPKDENDTEAWDALYKTLGRPDTPQDYKIELPSEVQVDEGGQALIDKMLPKLHEAGLSNEKANDLVATMAGELNTVIGGAQQQIQSNVEQEKTALQSEWGAKYNENMKIARQGALMLGWTEEEIDAMEGKVGFKGVMTAAHKAGTKITSAGLRGGEGEQGTVSKEQEMREWHALLEEGKKWVNDHGAPADPAYKDWLARKTAKANRIWGNTPANQAPTD